VVRGFDGLYTAEEVPGGVKRRLLRLITTGGGCGAPHLHERRRRFERLNPRVSNGEEL
jgi:hypothetical protein